MSKTQPRTGQVALVTGASGSIGTELSRQLAAQGADVAVHGRRRGVLDGLVGEIRNHGRASKAYAGDARDPKHLADVVADAEKVLGPVDTLVTLAGGDGSPRPTGSLSAERWRDVIDTDLSTVFFAIRAVLPGMIDRGRGRIVTVASSAGRRPYQSNAAYAAAKAGVVMLTEHVAKEYAHAGIRANCVAPSIVETARLRERAAPTQLEAIASQMPLGRIGRPSDVADAITYLTSDQSSWITGVTLDITGGMSL